MKFMKYLAVLAMALFALSSCETDVEQVRINPESEFVTPILSEQGDIVINGDNIDVESITFTCSEADFGQPIAVSYKLYFEKDGTETFVAESNYPAITIEKSDLNGKVVNNLGVEANSAATINAYIIAFAGASDLSTQKSNTISFTVQTFKAAMRNYYICGVFNGWNAGGAVEIWENKGGSNVYEAMLHLTEDAANSPGLSGFKVLKNQAWDGGEMGYGNFSTVGKDFTASSDGNLVLPAGIWHITVDLNNMAIDAKQYSQVDVMGSFNGWGDPVVMEYDPTNNIWKAAITGGSEYKFRLNGSWDINYGGGTEASELYPDGFELVQGAGNILAPGSGNIVVELHANCTPWAVTYSAAE
ncbi:MAG: SusE domain-containing protein [Rikenellaceae bacterium]|nr:SusE domain-containing protein [Rikenellaceae bacterium]